MTFDDATLRKAHELAALVISKQRSYGKGNILESPIDPKMNIAVRLNDKLQRLNNLIKQDINPQDETLQDTAKDIAGYGIVLWLLLDDEFQLPLEEH